MTDSYNADADLKSSVTKLLDALEAMDADAVRSQVHPDIEWRNSKLPAVRGKRWVQRVLTGVSHLVSSYEVVHVDPMRRDGETVHSDRKEIIRIGPLAAHIDIAGRYTFADGQLRVWDDRFSYRQLLRGLRLGRSA